MMAEHDEPVAQRPAQPGGIEAKRALEPGLEHGGDVRPSGRSPAGRSSRLHIIGVRVSDTTPDIRIATLTVTANSRNSRPIRPPISSSGMKTATSDRVIETIVKPISREPARAASSGRSPASIWRMMFSTMTTPSSMMKPTAMVSAISDTLSMV